ncbi:MBL fold metallo-hydrolase [Flavobacteriaceae bacterium AU392]|nr:MBL fold metallo-hydrolase [Flavobacteriaceae bacterium]RKM85491.1 MBL fold metallo-hydrolase [Flavobacteriaceae bacterium AU392]
MKITFLGTGTSLGIPIIGSTHPVCLSNDIKDKRLRVSVLIEWGSFTYVIDCGPDFRQQMLNSNCNKLDGILFTHEHSDHTAGLDDIRPFFFKQGSIPIYAHKRVINALKRRFDYIFETKNKYPSAPSVMEHTIENTPFVLGGKKIIPVNGYHNKLQVFGFKISDFVYLTDMKTIADEEIEKIKNVKILVVNALREEEHSSHFNLSEALAFIKKVNPQRAYLTHLSHLLGFHKDVERKLPENVFLAYDNLQLKL